MSFGDTVSDASSGRFSVVFTSRFGRLFAARLLALRCPSALWPYKNLNPLARKRESQSEL